MGVCKASARRGRAPYKLEIRLCSQLNSRLLDRQHRTIDSRKLEFFEL